MKNEEAVSPVIGVILMVAITVILAAVIAMFVFNMAGDVQSTKTVGVTAKLQGDDVIVTYIGGSDDPSLNYLRIIVRDVDGVTVDTVYSTETGQTDAVANAKKPDVGGKVTVDVTGKTGPFAVTVVGKFTDGTEVPLLDKTV